MLGEQRNVFTDQLLTPNEVHFAPGVQSCKSLCRTSPLIDDFYLCLNSRSECEHAFSYGSSYLCRSPERNKFSRRR
jgi:hypothetical protein